MAQYYTVVDIRGCELMAYLVKILCRNIPNITDPPKKVIYSGLQIHKEDEIHDVIIYAMQPTWMRILLHPTTQKQDLAWMRTQLGSMAVNLEERTDLKIDTHLDKEKTMSDIPQELKYTASHEWIRSEEDGSLTIGITDHAQGLLGDIVFVDLPDIGDEFEAEQDCMVIESVKATSDIYCPVEAEVVAINEELEESPELINVNAYHEGWIFRIMPLNDAQLETLMDADAYRELLESETD